MSMHDVYLLLLPMAGFSMACLFMFPKYFVLTLFFSKPCIIPVCLGLFYFRQSSFIFYHSIFLHFISKSLSQQITVGGNNYNEKSSVHYYHRGYTHSYRCDLRSQVSLKCSEKIQARKHITRWLRCIGRIQTDIMPFMAVRVNSFFQLLSHRQGLHALYGIHRS